MNSHDSEVQDVKRVAALRFIRQKLVGAATIIVASSLQDHVFAPSFADVLQAQKDLWDASYALGMEEGQVLIRDTDAANIRMEVIHRQAVAQGLHDDK